MRKKIFKFKALIIIPCLSILIFLTNFSLLAEADTTLQKIRDTVDKTKITDYEIHQIKQKLKSVGYDEEFRTIPVKDIVTVAELSKLVPKEIVAIAGTTVGGIVISPSILWAIAGVLSVLGISLTVYAVLKYLDWFRPEEVVDETTGETKIRFHDRQIDNAIEGNGHASVQGENFYKVFKSANLSDVPAGSFVSYGQVNLLASDRANVSTVVFARRYIYSEHAGRWVLNLQDQKEGDKTNIYITLDPALNRPFGTVVNEGYLEEGRLSSPINTYLSVWEPQYELFRTSRFMFNGEVYSNGTLIKSKVNFLGTGVDHWQSISNAIKGGYNTLTNGGRDHVYYKFNDMSDFVGTLWVQKISDSPSEDYLGVEFYQKSVTKDSVGNLNPTKPSHIDKDKDMEITIPKPPVVTLPTKPDIKPAPDHVCPVPENPPSPENPTDPVNPDTGGGGEGGGGTNPDTSGIISVLTKILNAVLSIPQLIFDLVKGLFIPSEPPTFSPNFDSLIKEKFPFIDDLKSLIPKFNNELSDKRLTIPFIDKFVITGTKYDYSVNGEIVLPEDFEKRVLIFRNSIKYIMYLMCLIIFVKKMMPKLVVTDSGE